MSDPITLKIFPNGNVRFWPVENGVDQVAIWVDGSEKYGQIIKTGQNYCLKGFEIVLSYLREGANKTGIPQRLWVDLVNPIARKAFDKVFGVPDIWYSFVEIFPEGEIQFKD